MINEKDLDKIQLKEPTRQDIWETHSTLEQMRLLKDRAPEIFKAIKHHEGLNEKLTPAEFYFVTGAYEQSIYYADEGSKSIDYSIFDAKELSHILYHAELRLEEYQAFVASIKTSNSNDGATLSIFNDNIEHLKQHIAMLTEFSNSKNPQQTTEAQPGDGNN